jgi:hypothetical protein
MKCWIIDSGYRGKAKEPAEFHNGFEYILQLKFYSVDELHCWIMFAQLMTS